MRVAVLEPCEADARQPFVRAAHCFIVRDPNGTSRSPAASRVASHAHMNAATAAMEGACVMLGSLTKYHSRNDPVTASVTASAASGAEKYRRVIRKQNQQPIRP